ncbi:DUF4142 domain-containing protein [Pelagibius sp. 7325]|uniref:DUF4142 domain-containing protein n=1 Tax=Pelagibius sp. 7325 TaxID=3131994 RepID=UPI0030EC61DF
MKQQLLRATAIAALTLVPTVVMAQSSGTSTQPQQQSDSPAQAEQMQVSQQDSEFAKQAAGGGQAEVELGRLATEQSQHEAVTQYGETLVDEHTEANEKLKEIAEEKGIELPGDLPAEAQEAKSRLSQMTGLDFDRAFIEQMVSDHQRTIELFETQAQDGQDAELKTFAENTLPTLREHLDEAQRIEEELSQQSTMQTADSAPTAGGTMADNTAGGMAAGKDPGDPTTRFQAALGDVTAKDLIGKTVVNASGDEVGEIQNLVIDQSDVVSAIIEVGGFLGIGAKQVAVPFDELQTGEDEAVWQTRATEEELENLPAYEEDSEGFLSFPN